MRLISLLRDAGPVAALVAGLAAAGCGSSSPGLRDDFSGAFIRAAATWDINHDGNVTCDEWKQYAANVFKDVDSNRDGKLSPQEFDKLAKADRLFLTANFSYYDADKKGYVTSNDLADKPNPAFEELDKDRTCIIRTYQLRAAISGESPESGGNPSAPASARPAGGARR